MRTSGRLAPADAGTGDDDQGWFPVGPECARLIPLAYRTRLE
jgi:hypothetical protein